MVDGLASAPFCTRRFEPSHLFALAKPVSSSSSGRPQIVWVNCNGKLWSAASSWLRHLHRQFCSSSFPSSGVGPGLVTLKPCSAAWGFKGRSHSPPRWGSEVSSLGTTDRWCSLAWRLGGRNASYRRWVGAPRVVWSTIRSLKQDVQDGPAPPAGGHESEVEHLSQTQSERGPALPARRRVRSDKGLAKGSRNKGLSGPATQFGGRASARLSSKADIKAKIEAISEGPNESPSGAEESLPGDRSAFGGLRNSLKKSAHATPEPQDRKPGRKWSKVADTRKTSESLSTSNQRVTEPATFLSDTEKTEVNAMSSPSAALRLQQESDRPRQASGVGKPNEQKRKKKGYSVDAQLRRDLNMCSKDGDVVRALEIYDRSVADGFVKWNQYSYNILLYLCSSAALGTLTARKSGTEMADGDRLNFKSAEEDLNGPGSAETPSGVKRPQKELGRNIGQAENGNGEAASGSGSTPMIPIVVSPEVMELAARRGFEIFEEMRKQKVPPNEATLTAVARLAVRREDGDLAFQMVKEMAAMNIAPKLRSYSPALATFCKLNLKDKAFEVDAHMVAAGVQPEEPELGALLQVCVELGLEKEVYSLLHRLRARVRDLSPITIASIEDWFLSQAGASAGQDTKQPGATALQQALITRGGGWHGLGWLGKGEWRSEWTKIDHQGCCQSCKRKLVTIDLDPEETENFAQSVSNLAISREAKPNDFKRFQEWLSRHGPFDAIVDGANVGLYNQNFVQGGFNFFQLNSVATTAQERGITRKPPLIVLHYGRTRYGAALAPSAQELIQKWSSSHTIYTTPNGSNDDWYWLYAAVKNKCLLITNDEMRDHLFQLLGNDFFPKWKERHQVHFMATTRGPKFRMPPPYSIVIQETEDGSWHFPKRCDDEGDTPLEWLCVTRAGSPAHHEALLHPDESAKIARNSRAAPYVSQDVDNNSDGMKNGYSRESGSPDSGDPGRRSRRAKRLRAISPTTSLLRKIIVADGGHRSFVSTPKIS